MSSRTHIPRAPRPFASEPRAFLYVEGPRDREIIEGWTWRASCRLAEHVSESTVILGGRQPARAREHFAEQRAENGPLREVRGLCVLDCDEAPAPAAPNDADGLEFFVWRRRHIESYLLVPAALARVLRNFDARSLRALGAELPAADDERGWRALDAKRRLALNGRVPWGRLARSLREDELHPEVQRLLARLALLFGVAAVSEVTPRSASRV